MNASTTSRDKSADRQVNKISRYWPLAALIVTGVFSGVLIAAGFAEISARNVLHGYMGVVLVIFAFLKIVDLDGFKNGFAMYDLLGRRVAAYGYIYPFVELGLGFSYLGFYAPMATYAATVALFVFGSIGVVKALRERIDIQCPCMGNVLKAPLSTVTLTEDLMMATMAGMLLIM